MIANINGLSANLNELSVAASKFDIVLCAETLVPARRHASEFLSPGFGSPALSLRDVRPGAHGLALYVRKGFPAFTRAKCECTCCEMMVVRVWNKFFICLEHSGTLVLTIVYLIFSLVVWL